MQTIRSFTTTVYNELPSCEQVAKYVSSSICSALRALSSLGSLFSSCTKSSQPCAVHVSSSKAENPTTSAVTDVALGILTPALANVGLVKSVGNFSGAGNEQDVVGASLRRDSNAGLEEELNTLMANADAAQQVKEATDLISDEDQLAQLEKELEEYEALHGKLLIADEDVFTETFEASENAALSLGVRKTLAQPLFNISPEEEAKMLADLGTL
jgi:hypothetical protein